MMHINFDVFVQRLTRTFSSPTKMAYDDHVYLAKLAEQAERYEGM